MRFNINFCINKNKGFDYCYYVCEKECPTISNFWHGYISNPLTMFWWVVNNKFIKCNKSAPKCSFLFRKKYCALKGKCG